MSVAELPEGLRDHFEGVLREKQAVVRMALNSSARGPLSPEQQVCVREALEESRTSPSVHTHCCGRYPLASY